MKLGIIISAILIAIFVLTVSNVSARFGNRHDGPITGPITSPITGPACKPGWGFGDKNHCHFGPPGLQKHESSESGNDDRQEKED